MALGPSRWSLALGVCGVRRYAAATSSSATSDTVDGRVARQVMNDGDAGSGKASRHAPDAPSGQHRLRQRANVRLVALQFYARLNPRHARFCWPAAADLLDVQEALCQALSLEDMLDADGGDERYCLAFLKALIGRLEQATGQVTRDAVGKEDVQVDDVVRVLAAVDRLKAHTLSWRAHVLR